MKKKSFLIIGFVDCFVGIIVVAKKLPKYIGNRSDAISLLVLFIGIISIITGIVLITIARRKNKGT